MPNRLTSGVTLDMVHVALVRKLREAAIVPAGALYPVLDDEVIPVKQPPFQRFVTIRLPSFKWAFGNVMTAAGTTKLSKLHCQGQTRTTLWLKNQVDIWGRFEEGMREAAAPEGGQLIGRLLNAFWEEELTDVNGDYILKRCLDFDGYEPPGPGSEDCRPFRLTWSLEFEWDLLSGG